MTSSAAPAPLTCTCAGYDNPVGRAEVKFAAVSVAGVDPSRVFTDKLSGSANTARPGLTAMLDYARPGDTVVVAAIDRLGRSVAEVTRTNRRS